MLISSWNVNSLRVRLPQVLQWLNSSPTELLLVQETKVTDDAFPEQDLSEHGLHTVFRGQKTYNGVAVIGRQALAVPDIAIPEVLDREKRICLVTHKDLLVVNVYVPNGSEVGSDKYAFKLQWLDTFTGWINELLTQYPNIIIGGDFNIAPDDRDVYDPEAWHERILCSSRERQALQDLLKTGFIDTFRRFNEESGHYSWWDYRAAAFRRNRGLRIDLLLASKALVEKCQGASIDATPRGWERPSDHAPVNLHLTGF